MMKMTEYFTHSNPNILQKQKKLRVEKFRPTERLQTFCKMCIVQCPLLQIAYKYGRRVSADTKAYYVGA